MSLKSAAEIATIIATVIAVFQCTSSNPSNVVVDFPRAEQTSTSNQQTKSQAKQLPENLNFDPRGTYLDPASPSYTGYKSWQCEGDIFPCGGTLEACMRSGRSGCK